MGNNQNDLDFSQFAEPEELTQQQPTSEALDFSDQAEPEVEAAPAPAPAPAPKLKQPDTEADDAKFYHKKLVNGVEYQKNKKFGTVYDPEGNVITDPTVLDAFGRSKPTKKALNEKQAVDWSKTQTDPSSTSLFQSLFPKAKYNSRAEAIAGLKKEAEDAEKIRYEKWLTSNRKEIGGKIYRRDGFGRIKQEGNDKWSPSDAERKGIEDQLGKFEPWIPKSDGNEFTNAFRKSVGPQNLKFIGQTLGAYADISGDTSLDMDSESLIQSGTEWAGQIREPSIQSLDKIEIMEPGGLSRLGDWTAQAAGSGLGSTVVPGTTGIIGGVLGGRVGGKWGTAAGSFVGAFMGSNMLNVGSMRETLMEEGLGNDFAGRSRTPEQEVQYTKDRVFRGKVAVAGGSVMSALDSILPGDIAEKLVGAVRKDVERKIAKRLIKGAVKGSIKESMTEATQEAIEYITGKLAAGKEINAADLGKRVLEAAAQGAVVGGPMQGVTDAATGGPPKGAPDFDPPQGTGMVTVNGQTMGYSNGQWTGPITQTAAPGKGNKQAPPPRAKAPPAQQSPVQPQQQAGLKPFTREVALQMFAEAGIPPSDIKTMTPEQIRATISDLIDQGSLPEGFAPPQGFASAAPAPGTAPMAPRAAQASPDATVGQEMAPDQPTAEPISDIKAQIADMQNPDSPREAVFLSADAWAHASEAIKGTKGAVKVENFDGKGGVLITRTKKIAQNAIKNRNAGVPMQNILGKATGAGTGKPADGTAVVQQITPDGAVVRESLVTPETQAQTEKDFERPGHTVQVVTPEEAIKRRDELVAADNAKPDFSDQSESDVGTKANPAKVETPEDLATVRQQVNPEPTEGQKAAGNYKHAHIKVQDFDIALETVKGGTRTGKDADGKDWSVTMPADYGRIKGTVGADGDQMDAYIGPDPSSDRVFVVDQLDLKTKRFDESKVFLGTKSAEEAQSLYDAAFSDQKGPQRRMAITEVSVDEFKKWLNDGDTKRPFSRSAIAKAVRQDGPRAIKDAGASGVAADQTALPQSEEQKVQVLRGEGNQGLPGVEGRLSDVSRGRGQAATSKSDAGPEEQQRGLRTVQHEVDDQETSIGKPSRQENGDSQRGEDDGGRSVSEIGVQNKSGEREAASRNERGEGPVTQQNSALEKEGSEQDGTIQVGSKTDLGDAFDSLLDELAPEEKPATEQPKPETKKPHPNEDRLVVETGVVLRTKSGRETSPAPRIDLTTDRKATVSIKNMLNWLQDEAIKEAEADGNDFMLTQLKAITRGKLTQSDKDSINLFLFDDHLGPTKKDVVRIEGEKKKPKPTKAAEPKAEEPKPAKTEEPETIFPASDEAEKLSIPFTSIKMDTAVTPTGTRIDVEYAIVELADLIPSNLQDGRKNPQYPQERQPRDRSKNDSDLQVQRIMRDFDPRQIDQSPRTDDGAMIVDDAGVVESGNGRVMTLERIYSDKKDLVDAYKTHLKEQGYPIEGKKQPVLVRIRRTKMDLGEIKTYTRDSNTDAKLSMSPAEKAMSDAALLSDATIALFRGGDIDEAANRDFVRAFIMEIVPENEQGEMRSGSGISQKAIQRIQGALLAKAYGDSDLVSKMMESANNDIKSIGGALVDIAPAWSQMKNEAKRGEISPDVDLTAQLLEAVRLVERSRSTGQPLALLVGQQDIFSGKTIHPHTEAFLRLMFRDAENWKNPRSRDKLVTALQIYVTEARKTHPGTDLLGQSASSPQDILSLANRKQLEGDGKNDDQTGFNFSRPKTDPRAGEGALPSGGSRAEQEAATSTEVGGLNAQEQGGGKNLVATPRPSSYGSSNTIITKARADELRAKLRAKLGGAQLNAGIDPEVVAAGTGLAVYHIEAGARKFLDMARAVAEDLGVAIQDLRPYLRSWYNGARDMLEDNGLDVSDMDTPEQVKEALKEIGNAPSSGNLLEPDSGTTAAQDGMGAADVPASAGAAGRSTETRGAKADAGSERPGGSSGIPQGHAPVVGSNGNFELPARQPEPPVSNPPTGEPAGSPDTGVEGLPDGRLSDEQVEGASRKAADIAKRRTAQRAAEPISVTPGDRANISDTLPMLFTEQQDDVFKTEQRFAKPDGHGMLLTNGTGTGKTFSGLGVIKRFAKQGKNNILIVAPSQGILMDWIKSAKDMGLDVTTLSSTTDSGKGIVGTTYANLGTNQNLVDRNWDLIVTDEAHKLSSDKDGTKTSALESLRALTLHPDGLFDRARRVLRDEWAKYEAAPRETQQKTDAYQAFRNKADPMVAAWRTQQRPKVLMMSATPFAYHFSLDYAEGYLFEFDRKLDGRQGYNTPDGRQQFYIEHLGYRMRTGKLTKPDANVRSEIMERQLHEYLKKQGSLAGRALEVDKDYDRKFVLVEDAIGTKIDEMLVFLADADDGKFRPLHDMVMKKFDYLSRMRLLEAIKAQRSISYLKKSIELGRKTVVFHDYNEGGGTSPFDLSISDDLKLTSYVGGKPTQVKAIDLYNEFRARNPDLAKLDFKAYLPPIQEIKKNFPNALIYNGTISNKNRNEAKALFNTDNNGYDIIVVQSAAGEAGISLHDITNIHQRTLLNLGMPIRPTTSLQQEGRVYRVGQASDALFRYMNTGTNWERWTFAGTIAQRASTAENFALGEQARTIKQSFIDAFNDADTYEPEPGEGKGGKALDRAQTNSLSAFEKAKTHYFGQAKNTKRRDQREGADYFATPEPLGLKMVEFAGLRSGEKILEPSAGHGAIARYFPEDSARTLVEPSNSLASRAALNSPGARVVNSTFEDLDIVNKYDAIVMNPPFGSGGKTAIEHVAKAARHLKNGGRIVALIPQGGMADKRFAEFMESDQADNLYLVGDIALPRVTFERAGTQVSAHIVILEKQTDMEVAGQLQQQNRDYSSAETINELFDRIENADFGQRLEPLTKDVEPLGLGPITAGGIDFNINDGSNAFYADLKSYAPDRFGGMARLAEKNNGSWHKTIKAFVFLKAEDRQAFIEGMFKAEDEAMTPAAESPAGQEQGPAGVSFKTGETTHTKTGKAIFVATLSSKVDGDTYKQVNAIAKKHGGSYSSFRGAGAIPGFHFQTADARAKFLAEMSPKQDQPPLAQKPLGGNVTQTPAFKRWFGASKVVDKSGMPLVVYHGSPDARNIVGPDGKFQTISERVYGEDPARMFFFTSSKAVAKTYADDRRAFDYQNAEPAVVPTYLAMQNPLELDAKGRTWVDLDGKGASVYTVASEAKRGGYDGFIVRNIRDDYNGVLKTPSDIFVVFASTQIKSVNNSGAFDPNDAGILKSVPLTKGVFYSALVRAVEAMKQEKAPKGQWMGAIRNAQGVKAEEIAWLGLEDWLGEQSGLVSKQSLLDFLRANQVQVQEVMKGGEIDDGDVEAWWTDEGGANEDTPFDNLSPDQADRARERYAEEVLEYSDAATKFPQYQLPGGENYREMLLTLPEKEKPKPINQKELEAGDILADFNRRMREKYGDMWFSKLSDTDKQEQSRLQLALDDAVSGYEPITALPDGWHSIYDRNARPGQEWGVIPAGQGHARNFNDMGRPTEAEAISSAITHYNSMGRIKAERDLRQRQEEERNKGFRSGHWSEPNVLAHVRFNERTTDGKRTLFIEEIQSDWHQKGRKQGYAAPQKIDWVKTDNDWAGKVAGGGFMIMQVQPGSPTAKRYDAHGKWQLLDVNNTTRMEFFDTADLAKSAASKKSNGVPDAPFKTTWPELALKRMVRWAAENGFDQVAWTPGEEQVDRYKEALRNAVDEVDWFKTDAGIHLTGRKNGKVVVNTTEKETALSDAIGKAMADQIIADPSQSGQISGDGLTISDTGMATFYDNMLVNAANKLGKKFGAKVGRSGIAKGGGKFEVVAPDGTTTVASSESLAKQIAKSLPGAIVRSAEKPTQVHTLPITPAMRGSVMEGQPLFRNDVVPAPEPMNKFFAVMSRKQQAEVEKQLQDTATRILGHRIRLELVDGTMDGDATGQYDPKTRTIEVAIKSSADFVETLGHEALHALRDLGVFTKAEWELLKREAAAMKLKEGNLIDLVRNAYDADYRKIFDLTEEQHEEVMQEEAVAFLIGSYVGGYLTTKPSGRAAQIIDKLIEFLQAVINLSQGLGFKTGKGVVRDIIAGKMKERQGQEPGRGFYMKGRRTGEVLAAEQKGLQQRKMPLSQPNRPISFQEPEDSVTAVWNSNQPLLARMAGAAENALLPIRRDLQDSMQDWSRVERAIEEQTGNPLNPALRVYQAETLYAGRTGERLEDLRMDELEPLAEEMHRLKIDLDTLDDFLIARHAPERNAHIASINPSMPDGGSGMMNADAQAVMARLANQGKIPALQQIAQRIDGLVSKSRRNLLNGGIIDQNTFQQWSSHYQNYVPLRGDPSHPDDGLVAAGKGKDTRTKVDHRAMGRRSRAESPTAWVIAQVQQSVILSEKARVGRAALRLARRFPNKNLWEVNQVVPKRIISKATGLVTTYMDHSENKRADNVLAVREGGNLYYVTLHHDGLAKGLKNMDGSSVHVILRAFQTFQRFYALMRTGLDPQFFIPNFLRDLQTAGVHIAADQGARILKETLRDIPKAMRGVWRGERGNLTGAWAQAYRDFAQAGGKVGVFGLENIDSIKSSIQADIALLQGGPIMTPYKAGRSAFKFMMDLNAAVENAVRLSLYAAMRRNGYSRDDAAYAAKEVTVNFNRKGNASKWLNAAYVFFNASVQGTTRVAKALVTSKLARRVAMGLFLGGMLQDIVNSMMSGDDDDDGENDYDQIPEWIRERNYIVMLPWGEKGNRLQIPMPWVYNVFHYAGTNVGRTLRGKVSPTEATANVLTALLQAANPLQSNSLAQTLTPTALDPVIELYANKDWKGDPIMPEESRGETPKPDSQKYWNSVNPTFKEAARIMNEMSGGDEIRPGAIDVSPETLEYLGEFMGGGVAATYNQVLSTAGKVWRGEEIDAERVPFVRKVYGTLNTTQARNEYYTMREAVKLTMDQLENAASERNQSTIELVKTEYAADLKAAPLFKETDKVLTRLRKARNLAQTDEQRTMIQEQMDTAMTKARKAYRQMLQEAGQK